MVNLITDRSLEHVNLHRRLAEKGWSNMTTSERTTWQSGDATKGAYNYTDLNRVETAVAELSEFFRLGLKTKTDWGNWDIPYLKEQGVERYLNNVKRVRDACPSSLGFPTLPNSMDNLTYEGANNIEKVLVLAYQYAESIARSGEIYSGEV